MGLFADWPAEEWVFFVFILVSLLIFTGAVGSYSDHWFIQGASAIQLLPIDLFFIPLAGLGPLFAIASVILFFAFLSKQVEWLSGGFGAVVIFCVIIVILGV